METVKKESAERKAEAIKEALKFFGDYGKGKRDMENWLILIFIILIIFSLRASLGRKGSKKWVNTEEFLRWKNKVSVRCDEQLLREYISFLKEYKGGYIRRRNGEIIFQDFLAREKGDLKGIFFHVIVPSRNISVKAKEEFRGYLRSIGVIGVDSRPEYEMRNGKLKADKNDKEQYARKVVGNRGEKKVREALKNLDPDKYFTVSGVVLKTGRKVKEFDHIVISDDAMFVLETKAFGMSEREQGVERAELYIEKGDHWRIKKYGKMRTIKSPTEQINDQKEFMKNFTDGILTDIKFILVLSNDELQVRKNCMPDYEILHIDKLIRYINNYKGIMNINDKFAIISKIDRNRIN